jgi:DNA-directed RNA polymerase subunit RPC12/RpoP
VGWVKRLMCRLTNSHKWVRLETPSEEAYECKRCGKRFFGKRRDKRIDADPLNDPFLDGGVGP